jgi:8-oxo-dGTP pyrophosphatase MutT (NUDIX family)
MKSASSWKMVLRQKRTDKDLMKQLNPWKTKVTTDIYDNPWISVHEDQVIRPDGKPGIYGVVHFKNKAIGILAIEDDHIYLVGQYRYPLKSYSWEIPEGGCPEDENPLSAAQRELFEEAGLTASSWRELGRSHLSNSVSDEEAIFYLATGLTEGVPEPDGCEELILKRVRFSEAVRMAMNGEITDALSIIAIMHYALLKGHCQT